MGIPGLTRFINNRTDYYMTPYRLKDTYLVIDGNSLLSQLYVNDKRNISAFGGDYDIYGKRVREFFANLRQCDVTPLVILDGGYERKKLDTIAKRRKDRIALLDTFSHTFCYHVIFPLLLSPVFVSVLQELDITCVQCFFEADREIAAVAKYLNCPLLSFDSDFYVFDALYIPFNMMDGYVTESVDGAYIECYVYDANRFIRQFNGFEKESLPLLAALLGNDYADNVVFERFFRHGLSSTTHLQSKITMLLHWLRNKSLDSAVQMILSYVAQGAVELARTAIKEAVDHYKLPKPVILPLLRLDGTPPKALLYEDHQLIKKLPERFIELYQTGRLSAGFINIIDLNRYYGQIQVEDVSNQSSHIISIPIITAIHEVFSAMTGVKTTLVLHTRSGQCDATIPLNHPVDDCFNGVNIKDIMKESRDVRMNVIYRVLSLTNEREAIEKSGDWTLFFICFVFWLKNTKTLPSHRHAIILMVLTNYLQTRVGHHGHVVRDKSSEVTFADRLAAIPDAEAFRFTEKLAKLRCHDPEVTHQDYSISTVHLFACLQSVLFHVSGFNALMDYPFPDIKFQEFYSGTLLYNLSFFLKRNPGRVFYALGDAPNIKSLYEYFVKEFSLGDIVESRPRHARRYNRR